MPEINQPVAVDPLRTHPAELSNGEKTTLRGRLIELIVTRLADLTTRSVQNVARYVDIEARESGCDTPAECFITSLVEAHYDWTHGLTPADAVEELESTEGFRANFNSLTARTREFNAMYAEVLNTKTEGTENA